MKNMQNILVALLLFLLLGSLGGIYYINKKYEETKNDEHKSVDVFVGDKNISVGQQITDKDIKTVKLPKTAVSFRALTKNEIVGKYAKINIYANEPILEEKLSRSAQIAADANLTAQKDKFNIRFVLFQNPNFNLKKGDKIDIIGVYKNNIDPTDNNYAIGYTAKNIKVLDFLRNGMSQERPSIKNDTPKQEKDNGDKKTQPVIFADEVLLDMNGAEIAKTLEILNKNHMLWMVLSNENKNDEELTKIQYDISVKQPKSVFKASAKEITQKTVHSEPKAQKTAPAVTYESGLGKQQ